MPGTGAGGGGGGGGISACAKALPKKLPEMKIDAIINCINLGCFFIFTNTSPFDKTTFSIDLYMLRFVNLYNFLYLSYRGHRRVIGNSRWWGL